MNLLSGNLQQRLLTADSHEFRALARAVAKGRGNRDLSVRYVCRLYSVCHFEALPNPVKAATLALLASR
jgi:hypothetical protein